ncbi:MAG: hypothetical protein J6L92_02560 [Clostridia bacterium]|nr:hypothetical protein [Clostridia bacterium]
MKTKILLPIMLSGLLFLCACTATSPTATPTAATTPSATVTPIPEKVDAWGQISQASLDYLSSLDGSIFYFVNDDYCQFSTAAYCYKNVDASKIDTDICSNKLSSTDSDLNVYGIMHNDKDNFLPLSEVSFPYPYNAENVTEELYLFFDFGESDHTLSHLSLHYPRNRNMHIEVLKYDPHTETPQNLLIVIKVLNFKLIEVADTISIS